MNKEDILAKLPEDARNQIGIRETRDTWELEHPWIEDQKLYADIINAIEAMGGKRGTFWNNAMHYEIPKVTESGVTPNVVKDDKTPAPDLSIPEKLYDLSKSVEKLGKLCPVLLDKNGHVIDGNHRMKLDPKWPTVTLSNIDTPVKRGLARIASNFCRRTVEPEELTREITMLIGYGLKPKQISELTGIGERTVYKHMPEHLKDKTKVEAGRAGGSAARVQQDSVPAVEQTVTTQETRQLVECEFCNVGTSKPQIWHSHQLCPTCKIKADLNPEPFDRKFKRGRLPPEPKAKEFKPTETWEHRKAIMQPQHSKAENKIVQKLRDANLGPVITERFFCAEGSIPDAYLPKYNAIIYVDGPPHEGREDRDDLLRQKVADRNRVRVLPVKVKNDSDKETERGFNEIMEAIKQ